MEQASSEAVEQVLEAVLGIISKVPFENRPLLRRLIIMLAYVNTFEDITKMNAANLGFGLPASVAPCLLANNGSAWCLGPAS